MKHLWSNGHILVYANAFWEVYKEPKMHKFKEIKESEKERKKGLKGRKGEYIENNI